MSPRVAKDAGVRRLELMGTAMGLFAERGYEQTSVQDITDAVGIAKGTFYHHFASKEDLLRQVADWRADELLERVTEVSVAMTGDPIRELRTLFGMIVAWQLEQEPDLTLLYLRVMYRDENLALRTRMTSSVFERMAPLFADVLAEGNELGVCSAEDPHITAEIVLATYRGLADHLAEMMLASEGEPERIREIVQHAHLVEHAIERVLGIEKDTLRLYDYDYLEAVLCAVLAPKEVP